MKKQVWLFTLVFMSIGTSCTRYLYVDTNGKTNRVSMAVENQNTKSTQSPFQDFDIRHINRSFNKYDSLQIERLGISDLRDVISNHNLTFLVLWNTGCPFSDHVSFKTIRSLLETISIDTSTALLLVSLNNSKIKEALIGNQYHLQSYYFADSIAVIAFKARHFIQSIDNESKLYSRFHDDISNIDFLVIDRHFNIVYFRPPFYFSDKGNTILKEMESLVLLIK